MEQREDNLRKIDEILAKYISEIDKEDVKYVHLELFNL